MKDNIKKAFNIMFFSLVIVVIFTFISIGGNFIKWSMFIAGLIATDIFLYFYKKSKYIYVLIYIIALISIYLIGAYLYTSPFLALRFVNCASCGPSGYLFMTNYFHIIDIGNNVTLYNGTYYVPYNVSLYEPTYSMFPFQTKVPNLLNQTITLKLNSDCGGEPLCNTTIEAKYKIINEKLTSNFSNYDPYYHSSIPVYLLTLRPEITNPEISNGLNISPELWGYETTFVESAEYNGIIIT